MAEAAYGPAGMITSGVEFDRRDRVRLAESYRLLEHALTYLKGDGPEGMTAYLVLLDPYLGDPADPSLVNEWRKKRPGLVEWHDYAIGKLAEYLKHKDLYVVWARRMTSREEKQVERRNDELFRLYQTYRDGDGMSRNKAIETASEHCGYSRSRGYEIVELREGKAS